MMAATREVKCRLLVMNASPGSLYLTRPDVLLRLEALLELTVACIAYQRIYPHHWGMFALLFLAPDISLLGYLRSANKASAAFYNLVHSYVLPLGLGVVAWERGGVLGVPLALIWLAHISFDRCLGYGLKFPESFRPTHIQSSATIGETPLAGKT
jgi:Domain of unknown function (DUF4260)